MYFNNFYVKHLSICCENKHNAYLNYPLPYTLVIYCSNDATDK